MTMAEFSAVIRKDVAWKVIVKAAGIIIGSSITIFSVGIVPILWIYQLKYGSDGVDGIRKDVTRIEDQVKGLSQTVGGLQITVAAVNQELKTSRGETNRGIEDIKRMLDPPIPRPAPRPRQASVPRAAQTQ